MSAISETYKRVHNILQFVVSYQIFLLQQGKRNLIITTRNGKQELSDESYFHKKGPCVGQTLKLSVEKTSGIC